MNKEIISISVIMPVFNAEKYIKESIESVLIQSYTDFEFIIIDDGSNDNSLNIIKEFKDSRIRLVTNTKNSGIVFSLNKALTFANGEFIARIDADDICLVDRFQVQVDFLRNNKDVGLCSGHFTTIDSNGKILKSFKVPISNEDCLMSFVFGNPIVHPAAMFKKSLALKVGGYRAGTEPAEDYDFWQRLSYQTKLENLNTILIEYRVHENNYSRTKKDLYTEKFTSIFKNDKRLSDLIIPRYMPLHIRCLMGTWMEKTSLKELREFISWKKSLIRKNKELKYFDTNSFNRYVNFTLTTLLLILLKSKNNSVSLKLLSICYTSFFNPFNILKIMGEKLKPQS